jgi:replication factor A1
MFNEAAEKFYPILEVNKAFIISKGTLKPSTKKGGPQKHPYEVYLDQNSLVQPCADPIDIPKHSYQFTPIQNLPDVQADELVDILGVVTDMGGLINFTTKAGKALTKRTITLLDVTSRSVELTLWGSQAENPFSTDSPNPIVAVKNAKVSSYNTRSLTMGQNSSLEVSPDLREAHELIGWYSTIGTSGVVYPVGGSTSNPGKEEMGHGTGRGQKNFPLKTFGQVKDEGLGRQIGKTDFADCKGTISLIKHENTLWYPACTNAVNGKPCNKKVVDQGNGSWKCERCGVAFNNKSLRYILTLAAADHTGNIWLQCFNDVAEKLLQRSADEVSTLKESNVPAFEAVFAEATFRQYKFKLKAATDTYQDESRVRYNILSATPVDFAEYSSYLLEEIKKF